MKDVVPWFTRLFVTHGGEVRGPIRWWWQLVALFDQARTAAELRQGGIERASLLSIGAVRNARRADRDPTQAWLLLVRAHQACGTDTIAAMRAAGGPEVARPEQLHRVVLSVCESEEASDEVVAIALREWMRDDAFLHLAPALQSDAHLRLAWRIVDTQLEQAAAAVAAAVALTSPASWTPVQKLFAGRVHCRAVPNDEAGHDWLHSALEEAPPGSELRRDCGRALSAVLDAAGDRLEAARVLESSGGSPEAIAMLYDAAGAHSDVLRVLQSAPGTRRAGWLEARAHLRLAAYDAVLDAVARAEEAPVVDVIKAGRLPDPVVYPAQDLHWELHRLRSQAFAAQGWLDEACEHAELAVEEASQAMLRGTRADIDLCEAELEALEARRQAEG